jgi:excisionase family DNA binding protein
MGMINFKHYNGGDVEMTKRHYLTVKEAADLLRVSTSAIYTWCGRKDMRFPKRYHGRRLVFVEAELLAWSTWYNELEANLATG